MEIQVGSVASSSIRMVGPDEPSDAVGEPSAGDATLATTGRVVRLSAAGLDEAELDKTVLVEAAPDGAIPDEMPLDEAGVVAEGFVSEGAGALTDDAWLGAVVEGAGQSQNAPNTTITPSAPPRTITPGVVLNHLRRGGSSDDVRMDGAKADGSGTDGVATEVTATDGAGICGAGAILST